MDSTFFIAGNICSGKDTFAEPFIKQDGFVKLAFADPLKDDVAEKHGVTREYLDEHKSEFRDELQAHGASKRKEDPDYWIKRWADARNFIDAPVICTDCRHFNEGMFALTFPSSVIIRIFLDEDYRKERIVELYGGITEEQEKHPSEAEVKLLPYHIAVPGNWPRDQIMRNFSCALVDWKSMGRPVHCGYGLQGERARFEHLERRIAHASNGK